jgi:hypothetical protein
MKRIVVLFTVLLSLFGMIVGNTSVAKTLTPEELQEFGLAPEDQGLVNNVQSLCVWGLYIDTQGSGAGDWDSRLFISNISLTPQAFDITVFSQGRRVLTERFLRPNEVIQETCESLGVCNTAGWLLVVSDAPFFGSTLFIINNLFGGGSFTAQTPLCF